MALKCFLFSFILISLFFLSSEVLCFNIPYSFASIQYVYKSHDIKYSRNVRSIRFNAVEDEFNPTLKPTASSPSIQPLSVISIILLILSSFNFILTCCCCSCFVYFVYLSRTRGIIHSLERVLWFMSIVLLRNQRTNTVNTGDVPLTSRVPSSNQEQPEQPGSSTMV